MHTEARDADFRSGPWVGFFQVQGVRVHQDLELTFRDGVLRGGGWDVAGDFLVRGSYQLDSGEVRLTKKYDGYKVTCRGFLDGSGIWGTWQAERRRGSGFHIWPLQAGGESPPTSAPD